MVIGHKGKWVWSKSWSLKGVPPFKMLFMDDNQPTCMKASGSHGAVEQAAGSGDVSLGLYRCPLVRGR